MDFDIQKFTSAAFKPREGEVAVPGLAPFFKGPARQDEQGNELPPVWKVRGLTGTELGHAAEAAARNRNRNALIEGLTAGKDDSLTSAVKEMLGTAGKVSDETAKKLEMLVQGSVDPQCTHQLAVKLNESFPVEFGMLVNEIVRLTGLGGEPGKPKPSSKTQKSKPPSASAT